MAVLLIAGWVASSHCLKNLFSEWCPVSTAWILEDGMAYTRITTLVFLFLYPDAIICFIHLLTVLRAVALNRRTRPINISTQRKLIWMLKKKAKLTYPLARLFEIQLRRDFFQSLPRWVAYASLFRQELHRWLTVDEGGSMAEDLEFLIVESVSLIVVFRIG